MIFRENLNARNSSRGNCLRRSDPYQYSILLRIAARLKGAPASLSAEDRQTYKKSAIKSSLFFSTSKETILERADFTLQLLMFVTVEKEEQMFIIFFLSSFYQPLSPRF